MIDIEKDFLTPNPYSRPQIPMDYVQTIDVHWSAAMNATAKNLRDAFERQVELKNNKALYHFSVDWDVALQWAPTTEVAWSIGVLHPSHYFPWILEKWGSSPDLHSIAVLLCHRDNEYGIYDRPTLNNAVELLTYLCQEHGLHPRTRILMHSQFTGKGLRGEDEDPDALPCPRYFVSNPPAWQHFVDEVEIRTAELEMERRNSRGTII
ncbi:hypothetical protein ES705_25929 [subsurface metagenome]